MTRLELPDLLWSPSPDARARSHLGKFWDLAEVRTGRTFEDYDALHRWSVGEPESFWGLYAEHAGIVMDEPATQIKGPDAMPGTKWFLGARLNYAKNMLQRRDDHPALIARNEQGKVACLSYRELYEDVERCADAMQNVGIQSGDRIAGIIGNGVEAVIAFLAGASIGAVWSSCSPDFGVAASIDRLGQIQPKLLFATASYHYGGREFSCIDAIHKVANGLNGLEQVVVVGNSDHDRLPDPRWTLWTEFMDRPSPKALRFEPLPFDHPLYILFSSGTTGVPKCMVHGAGSTLIQHRKEHQLHTDLNSEDVMLSLTTTGWMMWNWLVSGLAEGATLILYDGNPAYPSAEMPWLLIDELDITIFSTSAAFIEACIRADIPRLQHPSLRVVLPTGSPVSPTAFHWIQAAAGASVRISSMSGGTDIVSCFVHGNPLLPVYAGEIQCLGLGMDVAAFDPDGRPVRGVKAELVCRKPFPSMPVRFWNDPDGGAYRRAYFETYPNVWHHGDFVEITNRGGVVMYGRSDSTLNPKGVRIGTSEIYRPLETVPWLSDALAASLLSGTEEEVVLFLVVSDDGGLTATRQQELRDTISRAASPRHVPRHFVQVADVPRTRNGKLAELTVARILRGEHIANRDSLSNPECLAVFVSARDALMAESSG